jgi:hypothetical protein
MFYLNIVILSLCSFSGNTPTQDCRRFAPASLGRGEYEEKREFGDFVPFFMPKTWLRTVNTVEHLNPSDFVRIRISSLWSLIIFFGGFNHSKNPWLRH